MKRTTRPTCWRPIPKCLQLAIFALSVSAFEIVKAEGVQPDAFMGHSFGEIAALTCAGVFSVEDGAEIVCDRVESLALTAPRDGRMAAISAGRQKTSETLEQWSTTRGTVPLGSRLQIAVENSDFQTVVSGAAAEVEGFVSHCSTLGLSARRLDSPYGFHHPSMAMAAWEFSRRLRHRACSAANSQVYSPIVGRYYQANDDIRSLLANHLTEMVDFCSAVRRLDADGIEVFIECGALDALTKNVIRVLGPGKAKAFPTLGHQADDLSHVTRIINQLNLPPRMKTTVSTQVPRPDFEAFWRERSPIILDQLKAEFAKFLHPEWTNPTAEAEAPAAPIPVRTGSLNGNGHNPDLANGHVRDQGPKAVSRDQMFDELVVIYADAMEYPREVFKDEVELEAELGIDSVKQSEIIRRISTQYHLSLPANFRPGDFKTMGQIVDFVHKNQGQTAAAAAA